MSSADKGLCVIFCSSYYMYKGFKEVKTGCCGSGAYRGIYTCGGKRGDTEYELCDNPGEYFFFDSYHPSERAYQQFAELMWNGPPGVTGPYSLKSLFELTSLSKQHQIKNSAVPCS